MEAKGIEVGYAPTPNILESDEFARVDRSARQLPIGFDGD